MHILCFSQCNFRFVSVALSFCMGLFDFGFLKGISLCWANSRDFKPILYVYVYMWLLSNICECIWQCNNGQPAKPTKLSEPSWAESRLLCHGQHFHGHEKEAEVESWKLGVGCWVLGVRARLRRQTDEESILGSVLADVENEHHSQVLENPAPLTYPTSPSHIFG